ncbi:MAG TPA: DNA polymerase III subunit gamma/tau [Pseudobdellovibrionaceae bacterium]|nr:DNA polymerase III subunit gamma/tau [Pseudobdellovibrionaceae bacterium]
MSYQVIARKWRPQSFGDVVGQDHITQTLLNALRHQRLPHALLFTGPRGTGKTSSARILSKSLRCPNAVDFSPCNACSTCQEISQGNHIDVIEIDGASNNGVDSIRELREGVAFMPSQGKYKVYIIDEVHMLSNSAFNALLKTLEEPPGHVIFVLATTEVHKIPATILSRCQRFDFRRIPIKQIVERLGKITKAEGISATEEALWLIAKQGDGSMRDSQSLLDQVMNFCDGELTQEKLVSVLGLTDRSLLLRSLQHIVDRNKAEIFKVLNGLHLSGFDPDLLVREVLELVRHLLMCKVAPDNVAQFLDLPDSEFNFLMELAQKTSEEEVHLIFDMLLKGAQDLAKAQDPRLVCEVLFFRMAAAPTSLDLTKLFQDRETVIPSAKHSSLKESSVRLKESKIIPEVPKGLEKMKETIGIKDKWLHFVDHVRNDDALFAAKLENLLFHRLEGEKILLGIPERQVFLKDQFGSVEIAKKLQGFIASYWGPRYSFEIITEKKQQGQPSGESAQALVQKKKQSEEEVLQTRASQNPLVKSAQDVFKAKIISVTGITKPGGNS